MRNYINKYLCTCFLCVCFIPLLSTNTAAAERISTNIDTLEIPNQVTLVASGEELIAWLELNAKTGGTVKLTDNIVIEDLEYVYGGDPSIHIDAGEFSITIVGEVYIYIHLAV